MAEKYLPLYRKYRPSNFDEVVGQEVVVKTLRNAIAHNRVAHAYLFCGPRGTGKTSIARIFAKTLNCQNPQNGLPCNKCPHCLDMSNTISMDVIEIDAASNRKVEDARNLLEKVQFTPVLGKNKIYIIDEVHMLTTEAFNTLLKTLEEPPENLVFILATTEAHKVMETIVSRCQKFDFRRISVEDIKKRLQEIAMKENINIEDEAIEFIARRSQGGLRDALALLDQSTVLASDNKIISKSDIVTLLGSVDDNDLYNLADLIAQKDANNVISLLKSIVDKGNDPNQIIKELIGYFRNLMLASVCKTSDEAAKLLDISSEICGKILTQAQNFSSQELVQIIEELSNQEKNIRNSSNPYLWLDVAIINAATRENILAQKALIERIEALENSMKTGFMPRQTVKTNVETLKPRQMSEPQIQPQVQTEKQVDKEEKTEVVKPVEKAVNVEQKIVASENKVQAEPLKAENDGHKPLVELNWDTFLGELHSNPALFALVKAHTRPVVANSDKIELVFRNEIFIDKVKHKQQVLEEVAKKLCGTVPKIIMRKISEEDFKKKIPDAVTVSQPQNVVQQPEIKEETKKEEMVVSKEDIVEADTNLKKNKNADFAIYDLSDTTRQLIEVFSGKIID